VLDFRLRGELICLNVPFSLSTNEVLIALLGEPASRAIILASPQMSTVVEDAIRRISELGGTVRTGEILAVGVHLRAIYSLSDSGKLEHLSRGVYRLAGMPDLSDPDLATVAKRIPEGVICLSSALAIHGLTTQIPSSVHLALARGSRYP
jgi:hypothetical protein